MATEEEIKANIYKSLGMLSIVPPVVATAATVKIVEKSFQPLKKRVHLDW